MIEARPGTPFEPAEPKVEPDLELHRVNLEAPARRSPAASSISLPALSVKRARAFAAPARPRATTSSPYYAAMQKILKQC